MANDGKFSVELSEGHRPLADDEPVFVFRAQDKFMPAVLLYYAQLCEEEGSPEDHVEAVIQHRHRTIDWQQRNGSGIPN